MPYPVHSYGVPQNFMQGLMPAFVAKYQQDLQADRLQQQQEFQMEMIEKKEQAEQQKWQRDKGFDMFLESYKAYNKRYDDGANYTVLKPYAEVLSRMASQFGYKLPPDVLLDDSQRKEALKNEAELQIGKAYTALSGLPPGDPKSQQIMTSLVMKHAEYTKANRGKPHPNYENLVKEIQQQTLQQQTPGRGYETPEMKGLAEATTFGQREMGQQMNPRAAGELIQAGKGVPVMQDIHRPDTGAQDKIFKGQPMPGGWERGTRGFAPQKETGFVTDKTALDQIKEFALFSKDPNATRAQMLTRYTTLRQQNLTSMDLNRAREKALEDVMSEFTKPTPGGKKYTDDEIRKMRKSGDLRFLWD